MDPRRKIEQKYQIREVDSVPFIETHREIIDERQPRGPSVRREVIVIRIEKSALRLNLALLAFFVVVILGVVFLS